MRLGVLDVGSNTVHLLVVDAHRGAHPTPMHSDKSWLQLSDAIDGDRNLSEPGERRLTEVVAGASRSAKDFGCDDLLAFATSAVRDASNSAEVLERVRNGTGVDLQVLPGDEEARLTFLAVRRWFGWSAGRLLVLDIGGGSLEMARGVDESPDTAVSLPLGAGRLTREWLAEDPPSRAEVDKLREYVDDTLNDAVDELRSAGEPDRAAGTSKTFRSLARLAGAAPSSAGPRTRRCVTAPALRQLIAFVSRISSADLATLEGVSAARAHQLLAGAVVAESAMRQLELDEVEICPWALREGVILRRLDWMGSG